MGNMELWDKVCKTDPAHTKRINQRGGFTAIDASYQIMEATKAFGPVGQGWGYYVDKIERMDDVILAYVSFWHGDRSNVFGPQIGAAKMFGERIDVDAPKKAITDAITKCLSHLGFNADVFLGKFDDNKYVNQRAKEAEAEKVGEAIADGIKNAWADGVRDHLPGDATDHAVGVAFCDFMSSEVGEKKTVKTVNSYLSKRRAEIAFCEEHSPRELEQFKAYVQHRRDQLTETAHDAI